MLKSLTFSYDCCRKIWYLRQVKLGIQIDDFFYLLLIQAREQLCCVLREGEVISEKDG